MLHTSPQRLLGHAIDDDLATGEYMEGTHGYQRARIQLKGTPVRVVCVSLFLARVRVVAISFESPEPYYEKSRGGVWTRNFVSVLAVLC